MCKCAEIVVWVRKEKTSVYEWERSERRENFSVWETQSNLLNTYDLDKKWDMILGTQTWLPRGELFTTIWKLSFRDSVSLLANRVSETRFLCGIHVAVTTQISSLLDSFMKIESIRLDFHVYWSHVGCHVGSGRRPKPSLRGSVSKLKIEPLRLDMLEN